MEWNPTVWYGKYKEWLRSSKTGVVVDRFIRFFVITAVGGFFTNWVIGTSMIPVLQASFAAAAIATYDKLKNMWFESIREKDTAGFTKL